MSKWEWTASSLPWGIQKARGGSVSERYVRCGEQCSAFPAAATLLLLFLALQKRKIKVCEVSHMGLGSQDQLWKKPTNIWTFFNTMVQSPEALQRFLNETIVSHSDGGCHPLCPVDYPHLVTALKIPLFGQFSRHYMLLILVSPLAFVF